MGWFWSAFGGRATNYKPGAAWLSHRTLIPQRLAATLAHLLYSPEAFRSAAN